MASLKTLYGNDARDEENKERSGSKRTDISTPTVHTDTTTSVGHVDRMIQNCHLVWLDSSIDERNNNDCIEIIKRLRQIVNSVKTFTNIDECTDFITNIQYEKIFLIVCGTLSETMVHRVHDKDQINCFYIFCKHTEDHEQWAQQWAKIKGIYTDISSICTALKQDAFAFDQNLLSISFIKSSDGTPNQNLDQLDQSFMYTKILKDILLTIDFDADHISQFCAYCRENFGDNSAEVAHVTKLQQEYHHHQPIWWYTYDSFLDSMVNRALHWMEVTLIIKIGFFLRGLHHNIAALHAEQYDQHHRSDSFIVYRGQRLSQVTFDQLLQTQGGFLSFNSFLSTSQHKDVALEFARQTTATSSLMGVLFVLQIDPSILSPPFANVGSVSYYQEEHEILFSLHSIFRISRVTKIDNDDRLWQVELTLTSDDDPQLHALTDCIREKVDKVTGWFRLAKLMISVGQYREAKAFYETLLAQTTNEREKGEIYYQLGKIESSEEEYTKAITLSNKSLFIRQNALISERPEVTDCYDKIGNDNIQMKNFTTPLEEHQKALDIGEQPLSPDHPDLGTCDNISSVYDKMDGYSKALSYYEKALEINQTALPPNHPNLATTYSNIGLMYENMEEYLKALAFNGKAVEIWHTTLLPNRADLAISYARHASLHEKIGEHTNSLQYYEKALETDQTALTPNDPAVITANDNTDSVCNKMSKYSKSLSYCEKALEMRQATLAPDHPDLARSYNNIGLVYETMNEYSKALSNYEKARKIYRLYPFANYLHLATSYNSIGSLYDKMSDYSKALSYYEKVLKMRQKMLPPNHPDLAASRSNIASVSSKMKE